MSRDFAWQRGFGLFGVSASNQDAVIRYIRNQEAHHRKITYEEEFIASESPNPSGFPERARVPASRDEGESKDPHAPSSTTPRQGILFHDVRTAIFPPMREGRFYKFWV